MTPATCPTCRAQVIKVDCEVLEYVPTIPVVDVPRYVVVVQNVLGDLDAACLDALLDEEGAAPAVYRRHACHGVPAKREREKAMA